jgi:RNA polymerase sigma factor (sigma-70 family)
LAAVPSTGRADRVGRFAAPEADATHALYERYASQIFGYCLHQLGSREEAEDAVQSTFLNAFRGLKRGVVPEMEAAWLFKIAHNVCLSRRRSSWRRGRIESPADFEVVQEIAPAPSRRSDELIGLQDVLETMPENQRRAILLREWQGLSYHEIAEELDLSQSAVETLIFRARRSLASGLEQPPASARKRARARAGDFGNLLAGLKSMLLGSAAAVKVAATVAVISATTVVAAAPVQHRPHHARPAPAGPNSSIGHAVAPSLADPTVVARSQSPASAKHRRSRAGRGSPEAANASVISPPTIVDPPTTAALDETPLSPPSDTAPPPEQPSAPTQSAQPSAGDPAGQTTKGIDTSTGTTTTVTVPLSQTATSGLSETNGQNQSVSGSSSGSGSSASPPKSVPVPPTPAPPTPVTSTPVTTNPVTTSPSNGAGSQNTTVVAGGPLSQRLSTGLSASTSSTISPAG